MTSINRCICKPSFTGIHFQQNYVRFRFCSSLIIDIVHQPIFTVCRGLIFTFIFRSSVWFMVFGTSTSSGSSCPYPVKLNLLISFKTDSRASLLLVAILPDITADILVNFSSSCFEKQTVSVYPFLLQ